MRARILMAAALMIHAGSAWSVNVRGRIDANGPYGPAPVPNATVQLCWQGGCASAITGFDGMYYFMMVPGNYQFVVNGMVKGMVQLPNIPTFDISPIPLY